jgi:hypothetical protein
MLDIQFEAVGAENVRAGGEVDADISFVGVRGVSLTDGAEVICPR